MITKESLVQDREQANVALLKLKQKYRPSSESVYLVVEGKDDIAYYTCIFVRYPNFSNFEIIPANNRKNVVKTYEATDWNIYSDKKVFFFVDRDLSEITGEDTPVASNVYVTDEYSIENSLFNEQLFLTTLKIFFGIDDLEKEEIERLSSIYKAAQVEFERIFMPIMSWILFWRLKGLSCNLNNLNSGDFYKVKRGIPRLNEDIQDCLALSTTIHAKCGVTFTPQDLKCYEQMIGDNGGIHKFIRGKYVRSFFVKLLKSVVEEIPAIFPERKKPKAIVEIGPANALQLLCGYMKTPDSLHAFLTQTDI